MTTNSDYLKLRDWYYAPHYFPSRTFVALREYYKQCLRIQTPTSHNNELARQAAYEAVKPWLSTTTRERYYETFSHLRQLRRIDRD